MTSSASNNKDLIERRHPEWREHNLRWRWLLDSWEGGEAYRNAVYGIDFPFGLPVRNLIRHKHEYPDNRQGGTSIDVTYNPVAGNDQYSNANTDDYTLRLARTPVPEFVSEVVETHLSRIYAKEITRETTDANLTKWLSDIDGCGTPMDRWMSTTVAPLLMVFGCLDIIADHPEAPDYAEIVTRADQQIYKLDTCVASVILPENMVWWEIDSRGRYVECIVCELGKVDAKDGEKTSKPPHVYRHWTATDWTLYSYEGAEIETGTHSFGRVPIQRIFDRKRPRCKHVGLPRYEGIAESQREYYNRDSELILSDTTQAHPLLQGPEDYIQADGTVPIGPAWLLPKKKNNSGSAVSYEGFEVVNFPKDGADSIRQNLQMLRDRVDRAAMLTKPAGAAGTQGNTVSQSGTSKRLDQSGGNDLLSKIAVTLQDAERTIVALVLLVLNEQEPTPEQLDAVTIRYPKSFDLFTTDELGNAITQFQDLLSRVGPCPETQASLLKRLYRLMMPGLDDEDYQEIDDEIDDAVESASAMADQQQELNAAQMSSQKTQAESEIATTETPEDADPPETGTETQSKGSAGEAA